MQLALLHDAFEMAETAWEEAVRVTPEDSPHRGRVMREGARLALLRGDVDTAEARIWDAIRVSAGTFVTAPCAVLANAPALTVGKGLC